MYSIICTINSIRGRGKGKLSYKLALAQLLQLLVLAIQIIDTIFYMQHQCWAVGMCHFFSLCHHLVHLFLGSYANMQVKKKKILI